MCEINERPVVKISGHQPHSQEIDGHRCAESRLELFGAVVLAFARARVQPICKRNLLDIVFWQQANLSPGRIISPDSELGSALGEENLP